MTPAQIDALVLGYLEHRGIFGCDEDEAIMSIADTDALSEESVEDAVNRLVSSGEVTREGCYGLAFSLQEWSARLAKAAGNPSSAPAILEMLKGSA